MIRNWGASNWNHMESPYLAQSFRYGMITTHYVNEVSRVSALDGNISSGKL